MDIFDRHKRRSFSVGSKVAPVQQIFYYEKGLSNDLKFPSGKGFYPDEKDGVAGYNTDPARGADTFVPFSRMLYKKVPIQQGGFAITLDFQPQFIAIHADNIPNKITGYTGWAIKNGISSGIAVTGSTIKLDAVFEGNKITANPPTNPRTSGYNYDVVIC